MLILEKKKESLILYIHTANGEHYIIDNVDTMEVVTKCGIEITQLVGETLDGFRIRGGEE